MYLNMSVVIPTMNRPQSLKQTLNRILSQRNIPKQIVIVDQTQKKEIRQQNKLVIESLQTQAEIDYLYQETPSLTKARNKGLKKCKHDILVCMDDDVDVYDDVFKKINTIFLDDSIAMIAGLNEKDIRTNKNSLYGYFFGLKSFKFKNIGHVTRSMRGRFPQLIEGRVSTMWAMGFFFVIRKSLIQQWNLSWNELFQSYGYAEDLDFSYGYYLKAKKHGLKCIIDPEIVVCHNATEEYRIPSKKAVYMDMFHRMYLYYKYDHSFWGFVCMEWSNLGIFLESILRRRNPKIYYCAVKDSILLRKDIKKGELHYERYE